MNLAQYAKAIIGAIVAGLGALGTALVDGHVSAADCVAVALAFFVALGAVFAVPNAPAEASQRGHSELYTLLVVLLVIVVVVVLVRVLGVA